MSKKVIKKVKLGIDVDGVLRDFDSKAIEIFQRVYPEKINMEFINSYSYDFSGLIDVPKKELSKIWQETFCEEIYREAGLMPRVKEELKLLRDWCRKQKDVRYSFAVATAQIPRNMSHTYYWLGKHNFNFTEIYCNNNKHSLNIDYLVDDSPINYEKWISSGKSESKFIMFDRPQNRLITATNRITKFSELIEILKNTSQF